MIETHTSARIIYDTTDHFYQFISLQKKSLMITLIAFSKNIKFCQFLWTEHFMPQGY